jgi:conjugal transfer/type IV secretion protein DotA/TraY
MTMPFSPSPNDVSVLMLKKVFGPIVDVLVSGADPNTVSSASSLLGTLFVTFNSGLLVVGSIIIAYVAAMGAINTANDGEAMGKAWSTVWTPVRIVAGAGVLLPSASGYSFIQMLVLMIGLWSAGFGSTIYKAGMALSFLKPDGIVATSTSTPGSSYGLREFAKAYLPVAYCARAANTIYADAAGNPSVMANNAQADRMTTVDGRTDYTFFIKDRNAATNLAGGEPFCGTVKISTYTPAGSAEATGTSVAISTLHAGISSAKAAAAVALMTDIDNWVSTMPSDWTQPGWNNVNSAQFNSIVKTREDALVAQMTAQASGSEASINNGVDAFVTAMTDEGWASAGGWYQRVGAIRKEINGLMKEPAGSATEPSLSSLPDDSRAQALMGSVTTLAETIIKKAEEPGKGYDVTAAPAADFGSAFPKSGGSDINVSAMKDDIGSKFGSLVNTTMKGATDIMIGSGSGVDAVSRIKLTGDYLVLALTSVELAKVTIQTSVTALRVVVGAAGGVQVFGNKADFRGVTDPLWDWVVAVPIDMLKELGSYLKPMAFYFSVLLPSLPYTIFMVTVVGWLLSVVLTTIAAPMWAIMHMRPSQTFVGSEAQGYLLLMALFVRPALAVIGLFAAMLVADPVVDYIAQAFFAMRGAVVTSTGMFPGALVDFITFAWWMIAFGIVLLPVLYMIFGLPNALPDRVLAWLNVGVQDLGATQAASNIRGGVAMASMQQAASKSQPRRLPDEGSNGGAPRGLIGGGGPGRGDGGPRSSPGNTPLNAGHQGVAPATSDGLDASTGPTNQRGIGGGQGIASATGATAHSTAPLSAGTSNPPSSQVDFSERSGSQRLSDAVGVALGTAAVGAARTIKESGSRVLAGDVRGGVAALGSGIADVASATATEGAAAYREGAEARIAAAVASKQGSAPASTDTSRDAPLEQATDAPVDSDSVVSAGAEAPQATSQEDKA